MTIARSDVSLREQSRMAIAFNADRMTGRRRSPHDRNLEAYKRMMGSEM